MAKTYSWGGVHNNTSSSSYAGSYVYTPGVALLSTRADLNGNRTLYLFDVAAEYATGAGGINPTIVHNGVESSGGFKFASGGTFEFRIRYSSGTLTFGRTNGFGRAIDAGDGSEFTGGGTGGIPGRLTYAEVASAPQTPTASASGRNATVRFTGPADNGGSAVTNYTIQYSKDGGAWTGAVTNVSGVYTYNGLPPGSYRFRIYANNIAGPSPAAITGTLKVHAGGKVRSAGSWKDATVKVRSGGAWKDATVKVRVAGAWKDAL